VGVKDASRKDASLFVARGSIMVLVLTNEIAKIASIDLFRRGATGA
jgi:hypothetical protein